MTRKSKVEVDEGLMRKMIAGEVPLSTNVMREVQEPERKTENRVDTAVRENTQQPATAPETRRRRMTAIPEFEQTFMTPMEIRQRAALYVSIETKHKISKIIHLLGNERTRLTALVDNMLQFVIGIYSDELNYLHEKKNNRRPF